MGKRTTLLATVALPIVSLVWQPVQAATMYPAPTAFNDSNIIKVQSEGDPSEEIIKPKRKKERDGALPQADEQNSREERREKKRKAESDDQQQNSREERREKKKREAQSDEPQQKVREERREKKREAQSDEQQQNSREERREKKKREAEAQDQQQNSREERREKKRREAQPEETQQKTREERRRDSALPAVDEEQPERKRKADADEQKQKAREERRDKKREADAAEQKQQDREKARQERRERQADAEREREDDQQRAREERRERREKADRERQREEDTAGKPRRERERDKDRERIARDPSSSLETIILPLVGGAAVLDSDKDWDNGDGSLREERRRERAEERRNVRIRVPESDRDAQVGWDGGTVRYESAERERGERRDRRPRYDERDGWRVEQQFDDRAVINFDNQIIVRSDDERRLSRRASESYYEDLPNGRVREVIVRPNGDRVVTIRNRYGDVIQRSRINTSGREYVMFYAPEIDRDERPTFVDPGRRLPPMRLSIPVDDYIIDTSSQDDRDYRDFLERPPVEPVERVYSLDEVKYSARIRDKVRRIDLDTITFATGSADISMNQASTLRKVAEAMNKILDKDPGETFLIEGHTDAVGSDQSNLVLSDERAEAVANILTDVYDIAPENLATQGYGERFLKIDTDGAEQLNRRVTIRRVTPLVKPVAMAE